MAFPSLESKYNWIQTADDILQADKVKQTSYLWGHEKKYSLTQKCCSYICGGVSSQIPVRFWVFC